jgi:hypothetical protein
MSLLDLTNDPQRMGLLSLGLRLMQTPGKFGAALGSAGMGALSDVQQAQDRQAQGKEREQAQRMRAMQEQALQLQLAQTLQEQKRRQGVEEAYRGAMVSPATQALAGGGGPTMQNAQAMQGLTPKLDQGRLLQGLSSVDPIMAAQMLQPKPSDYKVVGGSLVEVGPGGVKEAYRAPDAAPKPTASLQEYEYARGQGYKGSFQQFQMELKKAGATSVSVGTGKAGEMETGYRKEFNSLPEVTRYKAAIPAYKAIESAVTRPGAQSEINLIYGLAKLYDPESVVREGEYATIANSQAIPEWIKGQAQRLAGGGRLTDATKQQILTEAQARIGTFQTEYEGAKQTYEGIVGRQGLDSRNIFTPVGSVTPAKAALKPTLTESEAAELKALRERFGAR